LTVELVKWLLIWLGKLGKTIWVVVDGAYAKASFLKPLLDQGVVVVSRLRKDAALFDVPSNKPGQRGRPRICGKNRISLAKGGWQQVECVLYGEAVVKTVKTFLAA
jgi:hypothetical protein